MTQNKNYSPKQIKHAIDPPKTPLCLRKYPFPDF